jgi:large subunit ribosomal protein L4e
MMPDSFPFALDGKFEEIDKTKNVIEALTKLGLANELTRVEGKKVRAGKGKSRGRKYKRKKGPLIVVAKKGKLYHAAKNIPGVDVVEARSLNTESLAPGSKAGRLTLWTSPAIDILEKENLFK